MEKKAGEAIRTPLRLVEEEPHLYAIIDRSRRILCQSNTDDAAKDVERKEIEWLEYIVKCVNAHEGLVEAVKGLLDKTTIVPTDGDLGAFVRKVSAAQAALSLAEKS